MRLEILENADNDEKDEIFKLKLKRAKQRYLNLVYPFDKKITDLPNDRAREWSENGVSESYARAGLSQDLLNELPPAKAGVPS